MSAQRIPIALIGLGWVGTHRHATAISRSREYKLIGVVDRNADRANILGRKLGVPSCQAEHLADVPWMREAKAIAIATPPHSHFDLVLEALNRGLDVLTEKPFAMRVEQGEQMLETAKQGGRILAVMHNFQFSRSALMLRHDIDSGILGCIRRMHAVQLSNPRRRLPVWYESLPGGLFFDESPHLLYLMRGFTSGELTLEHASILDSTEGHQTPDLVQARYSGISAQGDTFPVTLDMHFSAPLSEWHFAVMGDEAMGIIDVFRDIYIRLPNDDLHTAKTVIRSSLTATAQHWLQHFSSGLKHLSGTLDYGNNEVYRRFAKAIRTREAPPGISSTAAVEVLRMQHQLLNCRKAKND